MTQEKQQAQILHTHFHRAYARDNTYCDDAEVISFQLRLGGVEMIRLIQAGKLKPTEAVLKTLTGINESLLSHGKPLLEFDFTNDSKGQA